jgi:hypothetical protein
MIPKHFQLLLACVLLAFFGGCSSMVPHRKAVEKPTGIVEEDIQRDQVDQKPADTETPWPAEVEGPPAPPAEEPPPLTDPRDRPPRKFIWRDRKGPYRSWERADDEQ